MEKALLGGTRYATSAIHERQRRSGWCVFCYKAQAFLFLQYLYLVLVCILLYHISQLRKDKGKVKKALGGAWPPSAAAKQQGESVSQRTLRVSI